ncbi:hypothetical protein KCV07_g7366, partial [Aureobasidium melanogenum]
MATPREPDDTEIAPVKADEDNTPRDLSSRMPQRSAFPEIHDQAQNAPATSEGASGHQPGHPGHPGHRTSAEYQQHHYHADTSDPFHHLANAQPSGLASLPESSKDVPVMPQVPASYALQAPPNHLSALVQPTPHQPLHVGFPPCAMFGHRSTNHVYPNPPANVSLALLPNVISWADDRTVRDYLAIAVVRHKDIHDMVEREYGRIVKEHQDRKNEDASVLSFVNEHTKGLVYSSATQSNDSAQQKGPPLELASCSEPPPDRSAPAYARLHDADILSYISHAVAKLDKVKVLEILATAAMRHDDVYKETRRSLVEEATSELKNRSKLFEHLVAQDRLDFESALREENATRAAAPATRVTQNTQEIFSEDEYDGGDDEAEVVENDLETTDILTFTDNVRRVHYVLNTRYAGLRDSQQSYITLEAATKIEDQMQNISDQVVPHSLYDTKRNAISQLCKIGMMVVEANGYLGSEIQDHMVYNSVLVKSMQAVHDIMIRIAVELIYKDCSKYFEGLDKKRDICFEGFDEIVALFRGANT